MPEKIGYFIPKMLIISLIGIYCFTVLTTMVLFVLLGLGVVEMSNTAVSVLGGVTYSQAKLMRVIVKLTGQILLNGS
ncbi:TPA: hypothetical protein J5G41_003895 [Escherichia coli]|nr:hypothetical protein [Escherichia coli]HBA4352457.1 hypothetical protein [Escherichia coli]